MYLNKILAEKQKLLPNLPTHYEHIAPSRCDFLSALKTPDLALIAELKAASPSEGVLIKDYQPELLVKDYAEGGAAAVSVLTDTPFFGGSFSDLARVRRTTDLALLCKDFIIDVRQVLAARVHGADAVLIIVRIVNDEEIEALAVAALALNMLPLFEVFSEQDLARALQFSPSAILVNQRDLDTLVMDQAMQLHLLQSIPAPIIKVAASGIKDTKDLNAYRFQGHLLMDAVLLGTSLMRAENRRQKLQELNHVARAG